MFRVREGSCIFEFRGCSEIFGLASVFFACRLLTMMAYRAWGLDFGVYLGILGNVYFLDFFWGGVLQFLRTS